MSLETIDSFLGRKGLVRDNLLPYGPVYDEDANNFAVECRVSRYNTYVAGYIVRLLNNKVKYLPTSKSSKNTLFGAWRVNTPFCILGEGAFDAIAMQVNGLPGVATLGTRLTHLQFYHIKRDFKYILIAYDGDTTGVDSADTIYKKLQLHNIKSAILPMPNDIGIAEFLMMDGSKKIVIESLKFLVNS